MLKIAYSMLALWMILLLHPLASASTSPPGEGFWHTRGSQILDASNRPVRIAGVNWYGFETTKAVAGGLDFQDYRTILQIIKRNGYNALRIPLSNQMVETPSIPVDIKFSNANGPINSDLKGLNGLQILDKIVAYAGSQGLKVILDNHRSEAGDGTGLSGLWFTQAYPEAAWIADWRMLARRYASSPTVVGFDLRNEPHNASKGGACWGCGGPNDWRFAAERAGNAVLAINPHLLVFVEGIDTVEDDSYWWGGNLMGVRTAPVRLNVPHQLVYSAHDYGPVEATQRWFTPEMSDASLAAVWTRHWAFIAQQEIAPVWLGEFGVSLPQTGTPTDAEALESRWFQSLLHFLVENPRIGWTYWTLNGSDRYGILTPTYDALSSTTRQSALATIQASSKTVSSKPLQTATPIPGPQPAATISSATAVLAPIQCHITYTNLKDWKTGFTAGVAIQNVGSTPIHGWALTWTFDGQQKITQLWNARYTQNGTSVTLTNETWNDSIASSGEQAAIGFNATYTGENHVPTNFSLNNIPCK